MKDNNKHISVFSTFMDSVKDFNPFELRDKSSSEVIELGLGVFTNISECSEAALFLLDPEEFEFKFRSSTCPSGESNIKIIFEKLNDDGGIAAALSGTEIVEWVLSNSDNQDSFYVLVPLIAQAGVIGLAVLILSDEIFDKEAIYSVCRMHSNHFALHLYTYDLIREVVNLKEVTEQKIASKTQDIVKSTRELKNIIDMVQTGIMVVSCETNVITDANVMCLEIMCTNREKLLGTKRDDHFLLSDGLMNAEHNIIRKEVLLVRENGSLVPVILTSIKVTLNDEEYYLDSFIDISERKKMEEELQKARFELEKRVEERTEQLSEANILLKKEIDERIRAENDKMKLYWAIHQSRSSVVITGLNNEIEYVNPSFTKMTDYTNEDAISKNWDILRGGDLSRQEGYEIWENVRDGNDWHGEFRIRKKSGKLFWASVSLSPIRNLKGEITNYLGLLDDISERKKTEREIILAKEKAEESEKLKSTLMANMSHEFRTPLIGILGFSQILEMEVEDDDLQEMIKSISLSGNRLLSTLNGILSLSQMETIDINDSIKPYNLREEIWNIVESLKQTAEQKGLEYTLESIEEEIPVLIDIDLFSQSLTNIITNAIVYTKEGFVKISAKVISEESEKGVIVTVEDSGIGIAANDFNVIFEAFRQASEGYSRDFEGCGLGLTIAQKNIELLYGYITVESEPDVGSKFNIWLPYYESNGL